MYRNWNWFVFPGSALLVHPVTDAGATGVSTYLPGADEVSLCFMLIDTDLPLTHYGLVMLYGDIDLGQHWLR